MLSYFTDRPGFALGLAAGILLAAAAAGGYYLGRSNNGLSPGLFDRGVRADSASTGQNFAMCTGYVDDEEGIFTVDNLTGDMQLAVLNRRTGKWGGLFKGTVLGELRPEKGKPPRYLVTSGQVGFQRGSNVGQPARSVFYVMDESTGIYAAYSVFWNKTVASQGQAQAGNIVAVDVPAIARNSIVRQP
jgi:hypothetical protein